MSPIRRCTVVPGSGFNYTAGLIWDFSGRCRVDLGNYGMVRGMGVPEGRKG